MRGEKLSQPSLGQVAELHQIGPEPAAEDHLRLKGIIELPLSDEAVLYKECSQFLGCHSSLTELLTMLAKPRVPHLGMGKLVPESRDARR